MTPFRIFVGYDSKEPMAYHVCCHSILSRATIPVSITPLRQETLRAAGLYWRERNTMESTEFSFSRFLVPALCGFEGYAMFMDCDMLMRADIKELVDITVADDPWVSPGQQKSIWVCQHDYTPSTSAKFLGHKQTVYPRKNWSSVMVFNAARCHALTTSYVNAATGLDLHRFNWLPDAAIGAIPLEWNWLVGEYEANPEAKNLHYTLGGPWFSDFVACDHAEDWLAELKSMQR